MEGQHEKTAGAAAGVGSTQSLGLGNGKAKATGLLPDISQMTADQRAALRAALDAADDEGE